MKNVTGKNRRQPWREHGKLKQTDLLCLSKLIFLAKAHFLRLPNYRPCRRLKMCTRHFNLTDCCLRSVVSCLMFMQFFVAVFLIFSRSSFFWVFPLFFSGIFTLLFRYYPFLWISWNFSLFISLIFLFFTFCSFHRVSRLLLIHLGLMKTVNFYFLAKSSCVLTRWLPDDGME